MSMSMGMLALCFLVVAMLGIFLYMHNIYKLVKDIGKNEFTVKTLLRGVGVVIPILGIIMGVL